jgi:hypothetical protein
VHADNAVTFVTEERRSFRRNKRVRDDAGCFSPTLERSPGKKRRGFGAASSAMPCAIPAANYLASLILRDITDRSIDEEQRQVIVDTAPNGMLIIDHSGKKRWRTLRPSASSPIGPARSSDYP